MRVILTFWLGLAGALAVGAASRPLPGDTLFSLAAVVLVLEWVALFAIWRTQPTFRKLMHWASAGLWPRDGGAS